MPKLTMSVRDNDALGREFDRRIVNFLKADRYARTTGKIVATQVSRQVWQNRVNKRAVVAPRPGRSSTGGRMANHVRWLARDGGVELDLKTLDANAPHWIIQEIGTGQRATIKRGGDPNPSGRPGKGATYVKTVRSQRGRRIRSGLVFATNGKYSPPGSKTGEQLHLASKVQGVPPRAPSIRIRNEIRGQHFVKKGAEAGFRQYRESVLSAARQTFRKSVKP